jgi:hypothetical protein
MHTPHADDYKELIGTATALSMDDPFGHPVNFWAPARLLSPSNGATADYRASGAPRCRRSD